MALLATDKLVRRRRIYLSVELQGHTGPIKHNILPFAVANGQAMLTIFKLILLIFTSRLPDIEGFFVDQLLEDSARFYNPRVGDPVVYVFPLSSGKNKSYKSQICQVLRRV